MYFEIIMIISGVLLGGTIVFRSKKLDKGDIFYGGNGVQEFKDNFDELNVYIGKLYRYFKKIASQYTFHFLVRVLYYVQLFFTNVYGSARDKFMREAIKDKKAISRFWNTLKDYKQEIDVENKK